MYSPILDLNNYGSTGMVDRMGWRYWVKRWFVSWIEDKPLKPMSYPSRPPPPNCVTSNRRRVKSYADQYAQPLPVQPLHCKKCERFTA